MRKMFSKTALVAAAAILTLAVAGCGGSDKKAAQKSVKDTLTFATTNFCDGLEPTEAYFSWEVCRYAVGECLVKFDDKMKPSPWLAESWKMSDDKLSWTFKVRDCKFSNGNKVTGEAVKNSIERTMKKSARARAMFKMAGISANGQEVTIKTEKPVASLPGMMGDPLFLIVDTTVDGKVNFAKEGPVCTGPYAVKSFTKDKTVLVQNEHYWGGKAPFKNVNIVNINDPNSRAMAVQKGEVDVAVNIAPGDLQLFKDANKFNTSKISSIRSCMARFNVSKDKPLGDIKVRQALLRSLNREVYCKTLLQNTFIPGSPVLPPSVDFGFDEVKKLDKDQYNLESAKQLLAEAGWKDTNGDGIVDKDGKNLELDFYYYAGRAELPIFAEATQADAKKIGIKINLKQVDYNILDNIGKKGAYDLWITNILTLQAGDPEVYLNMYWKSNKNGSNPTNGSGYSNPKFDALSDQLAAEFDPAKRKALVIEMEKLIMEDSCGVVFGYPQTNMISNKTVTGAKMRSCDFYWITNEMAPAK